MKKAEEKNGRHIFLIRLVVLILKVKTQFKRRCKSALLLACRPQSHHRSRRLKGRGEPGAVYLILCCLYRREGACLGCLWPGLQCLLWPLREFHCRLSWLNPTLQSTLTWAGTCTPAVWPPSPNTQTPGKTCWDLMLTIFGGFTVTVVDANLCVIVMLSCREKLCCSSVV